ncbi:hypothetical protein PR202_ga28533 [Eleusine coracana subsp. coracana]|uniref:F-box domain-containing protein n=1 Tax=Eleusine coracana subsp. coracana TaxID=191504 RepID=A0AAV5DHC8_ELECO|nr:hypothetical protein PR202_ga28533 [Eleusine coracana subsp. coracana]
MPPPSAAVLMEELVEEYLLRIPPDDPATLFRAALVCKPWCRIVSGPRFRHRFRERHRIPPMLGFCYVIYDDPKDEDIARFAPTTSFKFKPPRRIRRFWRALHSRHGRVLLHAVNWGDGPFVVWDPITDEKRELPILPRLRDLYIWSATVFCAASSKCNHLDCQRGAFNVVAALTSCQEMRVYVYSSEVGAWSQVSAPKPGDYFLKEPAAPGALVGNAVYFSCFYNKKILKYDLGTRKISLIDGPPPCSSEFQGASVLMTTEDGRLGVAYVLNFKLHI